MQEFFPSTKNAYIESVEEYGEVLETVVIEDIFMPELLTLLAKNEDAELLSNMFNYFEEIINNPKRLELLNEVDVLIDGKFQIANRNIMLKYRGSSNQRVIDASKSLKENKVIELK